MILCGWNTFLTAGFSWNLPSIVDSRIIHENKVEKERVQKVTQEIFGNYPQPRLEFAQYKVGRRYNLTISYQYFLKRTVDYQYLPIITIKVKLSSWKLW